MLLLEILHIVPAAVSGEHPGKPQNAYRRAGGWTAMQGPVRPSLSEIMRAREGNCRWCGLLNVHRNVLSVRQAKHSTNSTPNLQNPSNRNSYATQHRHKRYRRRLVHGPEAAVVAPPTKRRKV
jgi:hypothetical protein